VIDPSQSLEEKGFAILASCLTEQMVNRLCLHLSDDQHAQRNLLDVPIVHELAASKAVKPIIDCLLGKESFAVRGILFNKTPDANWKVVWHQDRTIAVRERKNAADFGPWSIKGGVQHVQHPASLMSRMIAIRLHLDASRETNGPLRVIPGSHRDGYLSSADIDSWKVAPSVTCIVARGGAILMRPLLLLRRLPQNPCRVV
jgi:ectoine hydroxylase-related dioxygenase (phytanoyl-CoA dioxygenase family)